MKNRYIIAVVGKELFPRRMHLEKEFGEVLYEQLISVLEIVGDECTNNEIPHCRLGVYLDTNNPGTRKFLLDEKHFDSICDNFGHSFYKHLKDYSKREQRKGTDVLMQLNSGNISMKEFEDNIGQ